MRRNEAQMSLVLSVVLGALVGLVVVAFILLTGRLAARMYPAGGSGWRRILVPVLGSLSSGYMLWKYFPGARGSGIPQTKAAIFIEDGRIDLRTVIGKLFCCSTSLASGIALGREGPSVHIGAGIVSVVARSLGLDAKQVKALVPAGCAAALAAAFNTPIAAVLFSLEEILGDLHAAVLGSVVMSAATSWMVLHLILGDEPLFHVAGYKLVNPAEALVYAVLGLAGGLVAGGFVKLLLWLRLCFRKLPPWSVWLQPAIGGLTVGILGYFAPEVLGVGYGAVERVLNGEIVLGVVMLLGLLKIVATTVCYSSGNAGGIFGPTLFIGAMTGAAVGGSAHLLFPGWTAGPGAYALVGMGAAFAGVIRTPMTSVIMIFEITRDYTIIVPLMIANMIAFFISKKVQHQPIYEALAAQDGVHLPTRSEEEAREVGDIMQAVPAILLRDSAVGEVLVWMERQRFDVVPVLQGGLLRGVLTRLELEESPADAKLADLLEARELSPQGALALPHLHPDQSLSVALERLGAEGCSVLPVVSRAGGLEVIGLLTVDDALRGYGLELSA